MTVCTEFEGAINEKDAQPGSSKLTSETPTRTVTGAPDTPTTKQRRRENSAACAKREAEKPCIGLGLEVARAMAVGTFRNGGRLSVSVFRWREQLAMVADQLPTECDYSNLNRGFAKWDLAP